MSRRSSHGRKRKPERIHRNKKDEDWRVYRELQSPSKSGWTDFTTPAAYTFSTRFGMNDFGKSVAEMVDIDSFRNYSGFREVLGYVNTAENQQQKGSLGGIK